MIKIYKREPEGSYLENSGSLPSEVLCLVAKYEDKFTKHEGDIYKTLSTGERYKISFRPYPNYYEERESSNTY